MISGGHDMPSTTQVTSGPIDRISNSVGPVTVWVPCWSTGSKPCWLTGRGFYCQHQQHMQHIRMPVGEREGAQYGGTTCICMLMCGFKVQEISSHMHALTAQAPSCDQQPLKAHVSWPCSSQMSIQVFLRPSQA